jgi:hypothetical protein
MKLDQPTLNALADADIQTINAPELAALIGVAADDAEIILADLEEYRIVSPPDSNARRAVFIGPHDRAVILPA